MRVGRKIFSPLYTCPATTHVLTDICVFLDWAGKCLNVVRARSLLLKVIYVHVVGENLIKEDFFLSRLFSAVSIA